MARFTCFGEILIRLSAPGGELLLQTPHLSTHVGGAEANVAVSLASFGHDARMVSFVPDNALADAALGELRRHSVDTRFVAGAAGRMGLYFLTPGAGQRPSDIVYDRTHSAFASGRTQAIDWRAALEGVDWLHISGVTPAVSAAAAALALKAMHTARELRVKVSFDANYRAKLWELRTDEPRAVLDPMFAEADLLFAEARDIALVTGEQTANTEDAARKAFARYPKTAAHHDNGAQNHQHRSP